MAWMSLVWPSYIDCSMNRIQTNAYTVAVIPWNSLFRLIFRIKAWRINWYTNECMHHRPHAPQPPNLSKPLLFELVSADAQIQPGLMMFHYNCIIFVREIKFQCSWLRHFVLIIECIEFSISVGMRTLLGKKSLRKCTWIIKF